MIFNYQEHCISASFLKLFFFYFYLLRSKWSLPEEIESKYPYIFFGRQHNEVFISQCHCNATCHCLIKTQWLTLYSASHSLITLAGILVRNHDNHYVFLYDIT